MTLTDIIALSKAGFTAEQIRKLSTLEQIPTQHQATVPQQTMPPASVPQQTMPPASVPQQTMPPASVPQQTAPAAQSGDWMTELVNRIQKANVGSVNNLVPQTETTEQILASIINPKEE